MAACVVALVVVFAAYGTYEYYRLHAPGGRPTLVVYAYSSLFGGNPTVFDAVFGAFERAHNVTIQVEYPAGNLVRTLASEQNSPRADLVIGLDEITATQADSAGLLVPYTSSELSSVPPDLVRALSPDHAATPYEFGNLAIDYNSSFSAATHGAVAQSSFADIAANASWASSLMIEDPTADITGEEFLVWQIQFYTQVLHQDWRVFWKSVDHSIRTAPDWTTAFGAFSTPPGNPSMVASYATDPAYAAYSGTPGAFGATTSYWNGTYYGWRSIYGIGIVAGSAHPTLDQEFIDWFLRGGVQSQIPTNEWEYPANASVALPSVFQYAFAPAGERTLNDGTTPTAVVQSLKGWLNDWQSIANQYG